MNEVDDLTIQLFADAELRLRDRVASLEADVDAYRLLAQQTLHALHDLTGKHDRLRHQYRYLVEQCRALRAQLRRQQVAA